MSRKWIKAWIATEATQLKLKLNPPWMFCSVEATIQFLPLYRTRFIAEEELDKDTSGDGRPISNADSLGSLVRITVHI